MLKEVNVKENPDLSKDTKSGVVKNKNRRAFLAARKRKALFEKQRKETEELNSVKAELEEMRKLVNSVLKETKKQTKKKKTDNNE